MTIVSPPARFRILHAGPHVSVQDSGREGWMRYGVPRSGPMDRGAFAIGQAALAHSVSGTTPANAAIEVSPGGLHLICTEGTAGAAVTGGGFRLDLHSAAGVISYDSWHCFTIRAGETLILRSGPWGNWCYLAFAGTLEARRWLGSAATHTPSGLGGGILSPGDELVVMDPRDVPATPVICPVWCRPRRCLSVVPGPQERFFPSPTLERFAGSIFTLTGAFDRMGTRLSGPPLPPEDALGIPSEPTLRGSVQVAGDGVATVLMADHQTTGGYPRIATVIDSELDGFAQLRPGDRLRFLPLPPEQAEALDRRRMRERTTYIERVRQLALGALTGR